MNIILVLWCGSLSVTGYYCFKCYNLNFTAPHEITQPVHVSRLKSKKHLPQWFTDFGIYFMEIWRLKFWGDLASDPVQSMCLKTKLCSRVSVVGLFLHIY